METIFEKLQSGLFRAKCGIVYCKIKEIIDDGHTYNAVLITSGQLCNFKNDEVVYEY